MSKPLNNDPSQPWNDPMYLEDPFAPHNDTFREDDPSEPWNDPAGTADDLSCDDRRAYGLQCKCDDDDL